MKKILKNIAIFATLVVAPRIYGSDGGNINSSVNTQLARYYQQTISWHDCSSGNFGADLGEDLLNQLSGRTSCATVNAPLDYDDVSKGSVGIGILRVKAEKPVSRVGALWMNSGGPGASGLKLPLTLGKLFFLGNPADPVGAKLLQLSNSYDLIGFDPRGVGSSVQLVCSSSAASGFIPFTDRSATTISAQINYAQAVASACGGTPLTPYINTEYTARDMDIIRAALGYEKLNYYGVSYGTELGAYYASLFPGSTGRMVLDSVVDITTPLAEYGIVQAPALQNIVDGIVSPYVAAYNNVFGLGSTVGAVRSITTSGPSWLTSFLGDTLYKPLFDQSQIDTVIADLAAAKGINSVLAENPAISPDGLASAVAALQFSPQGGAPYEAVAKKTAALAVNAYRDFSSGTTDPLKFDGTRQAVTCNDVALIHQSQQYWTDLGNSLAQSAPLIGGTLAEQPCLYWQFTPRIPPNFAPAAALPILLLQNENDGATPLLGAQTTAAVLKGSRLVVQSTTYTHGALGSDNQCIDGYFADYLLDGSLPAGNATCAGDSLPNLTPAEDLPITDAQTSAGISPSASRAVVKSQSTEMYTDPGQAETLLQKLRDMIR